MTEVINDGTSKMVAVDKIQPHPRNVNEGDQGAIGESMDENGFYGVVLVQKSSGNILAGKHRWLEAKRRGIKQVPVMYVDVDDERAIRIMLADNRTARLGYDDEHSLKDVLTELADTDAGLAGTGFDGDDLDELVRKLDPDNHPYGTPESEGIDYLPQFGVIVVCADDAEQEKVYNQLQAMGLICKVVVT